MCFEKFSYIENLNKLKQSLSHFQIILRGDDGSKPSKIYFNDSIPIDSLKEQDTEDKNSPQKNGPSVPEKDKDDKTVLSTLPKAVTKEVEGYEKKIGEAEPLPNSYVRFIERTGEELDGKIFF